jgi:hypothetical protein
MSVSSWIFSALGMIVSLLHVVDLDQGGLFIPDPNISIPDPEFGVQKGPGSGFTRKNSSIFYPKKIVSKHPEMSSGIFTPDPGSIVSKKSTVSPDPGSATLKGKPTSHLIIWWKAKYNSFHPHSLSKPSPPSFC